ncbi:hypothetical protein [Mesorhizobium sp. M0323]|uniref:hypothetical protein n=1 Tax=Mesorhizobium sp. M0323 TaxID=2956938 RepID=UPI003339814A
MAASDILFFTPALLGLAAMALAKLPDLIDAITGDDQAPFDRFYMDARKRGLDYAGIPRNGMSAPSLLRCAVTPHRP